MIQVRVKSIMTEAIGIKSYELVSADGTPLPPFAAGAHVDLHLEPSLVRQYSLCNDPAESDRYVIAVKREATSRGGSTTMHDRVRPGSFLKISQPRNNFALAADARHSRLIAGGIGITPLLAMAHALSARGASYDLHYFARSSEHAAFRGRLGREIFLGKVNFHYLVEPNEVDSRVTELVAQRPEGAHLYLCGPKPFMDMVLARSKTAWPNDAVHLEYFTADANALAMSRESFQVKLARSGAVFDVPADETIVDVLRRHGIAIETSCEQGVCGTCLTPVKEGTPDHRDQFLTDAEKGANDRMTPCVSRSKGPLLVLDL